MNEIYFFICFFCNRVYILFVRRENFSCHVVSYRVCDGKVSTQDCSTSTYSEGLTAGRDRHIALLELYRAGAWWRIHHRIQPAGGEALPE